VSCRLVGLGAALVLLAACSSADDDGTDAVRASTAPAPTITTAGPATTQPATVPIVTSLPPTAPPATPTIAPSPSAPLFAGAVTPLPAEVQAAMTGSSWRPGCPVGLDDLRLLELSYWDLAGVARTGRMVVHHEHADAVLGAFRRLFEARFTIERMELVDAFGGDDDASMAANNTSGFNCRTISGTSAWSEHAYGHAVDVNPRFNPWVTAGRVDPPNGAEFVDRSQQRPGMIHEGDAAVQAFAAIGWGWGGRFSRAKDYQHFSASGR
jgi:poly-gamma-glutamate synthesis protein (capsule biosynthesis protein)